MSSNNPDIEAIRQEEFGLFAKIAEACLDGRDQISFTFSSPLTQAHILTKLKRMGFQLESVFEMTHIISWES
jgi:hypothetical protein